MISPGTLKLIARIISYARNEPKKLINIITELDEANKSVFVHSGEDIDEFDSGSDSGSDSDDPLNDLIRQLGEIDGHSIDDMMEKMDDWYELLCKWDRSMADIWKPDATKIDVLNTMVLYCKNAEILFGIRPNEVDPTVLSTCDYRDSLVFLKFSSLMSLLSVYCKMDELYIRLDVRNPYAYQEALYTMLYRIVKLTFTLINTALNIINGADGFVCDYSDHPPPDTRLVYDTLTNPSYLEQIYHLSSLLVNFDLDYPKVNGSESSSPFGLG